MRLQILVATTAFQGLRRNDFAHVPEGEIVVFGHTCPWPKGSTEGSCGCGRSLVGIAAKRGTTTLRVRLFAGNVTDYENVLREAGVADVTEQATRILAAAGEFYEGDVLEYRDREFKRRTHATADE